LTLPTPWRKIDRSFPDPSAVSTFELRSSSRSGLDARHRTTAFARAALVIACLALPATLTSPARAGDLSLGLQTGMYRPQITDPGDPEQSVDTTSFFLSPIVDLRFGRLGFTTKYLYSSYTFDDIGSSGPDLPPTVNRNAQRHDFDAAFKYSWLASDEFLFAVTPFAGVRYEIQNITQSIPVTGPDQELTAADNSILSVVTGATFSYTFRDTGLTPYLVGSAFVYSLVDAATVTTGDANPDGFGGFAVEGGLSYSLYSVLQAPVSFTLGYRYQRIEPESFKEEIQQAIGGAFYHFVDLF
jgi:hypothetical protein